ncbi:hypothetical protein BaRGS_00015324, partial [Batillaria attramentaria]
SLLLSVYNFSSNETSTLPSLELDQLRGERGLAEVLGVCNQGGTVGQSRAVVVDRVLANHASCGRHARFCRVAVGGSIGIRPLCSPGMCGVREFDPLTH